MINSPVPPFAEELLGQCRPMTTQAGTEEDEAATESMVTWLDTQYPRETQAGFNRRLHALVEIERLASEWVKSLGASNARLLTFGSFRLGVITQSSDIDSVILIPASIARERFFTEFASLLASLPEVTECNSVPDARVPVIKVKFREMSVDLLAARVPQQYLEPEIETIDENSIWLVEEKCMKSMNGVRVADRILSLVPDCETFRIATRMIKYWAMQRMIYSNAMGYVGGVSWALMVAKICQYYPYVSAKEIVYRFFQAFAGWSWEENKPVTLAGIQDKPIPRGLNPQQYKEWNGSKYLSDKQQPFPIITPIFPCHNTAYNVTEVQRDIIVREIKRGHVITDIMAINPEISWDDLCSPFPFFESFERYLVMEVYAETEPILLKFRGLVESRMRSLIKSLWETAGVEARPNTDFFKDEEVVGGKFYLGLSTSQEGDYDLRHAVQTFYTDTMEKAIYNPEWSQGIGNLGLSVKCVTRESLEEPTFKAKRMRVE